MLMSLCPAMLQNLSKCFSTLNPSDLHMPCMAGPSQPMAPKFNALRPNRTYQTLTHLGHNESKTFQAPFYTIIDQLILPCYPP